MNLEREINDAQVGCFSFVFQTLIRHLFSFVFSVWIIYDLEELLEELLMAWNTKGLSEILNVKYI